MVKVTLSEVDINAIGASLDERSQRISTELAWLRRMSATSSRDYAIDCNEMALRHIVSARHAILAAIEEPEYPEDATFQNIFEGMDDYGVWTEPEKREAFGR
jgi:hypothetical protein